MVVRLTRAVGVEEEEEEEEEKVKILIHSLQVSLQVFSYQKMSQHWIISVRP